jgi:hypothetical protein
MGKRSFATAAVGQLIVRELLQKGALNVLERT